MGDYHARFCERFKVKFLLSTRLRGWKTKVGRKLLRFPPTRLYYFVICQIVTVVRPLFILQLL